MKILFIILASMFYFCTSKAHIDKYGKAYIRSEVKSVVLSINVTKFNMDEII